MVVNANTPSSSPQSSPNKSKEEAAEVNAVQARDLSHADELSGAMNKNLQELTSSGNSVDPSDSSVDPREADRSMASVAEDVSTKAQMEKVTENSAGSKPEVSSLTIEKSEPSENDKRSVDAGSVAEIESTKVGKLGAQAEDTCMKHEDTVSKVDLVDLKPHLQVAALEHDHKGDDHISHYHVDAALDQKSYDTATHSKESQTDKRSCSVSDADVSHSEIDDERTLKKSPGAMQSGESDIMEGDSSSPIHNKKTQTPHKSGEGKKDNLPRSPSAQRGAAAVLAMLAKKQERSSPEKADAKTSQEAEDGSAGIGQNQTASTLEAADKTVDLNKAPHFDKKPSDIPYLKESEDLEAKTLDNTNAMTSDNADVKMSDIADAKKSDSADAKPSDSADTKPCDHADKPCDSVGKPCDSVDKPCDSADTKPCDGADTKPCDGADTKPCDGADAKPCEGTDAKQCDRADAKPCDCADAKSCDRADARSCDRADARSCDRADAKPSDSADAKPCDGADTKPCDGADTKPCDGTDTKPCDGADTKPCDGADTKPCDGADTKPCDGADTKPCDGANAKQCDGANAKPCDGADTKPCDGADTKPCDGADTKPCDGADTKPCDGADTKPCDGADTKPCDGADTKPCDGADTKPCDGANAKQCDRADAKPCDCADAKSCDRAYAKPSDSADAKPSYSFIEKPVESPGKTTLDNREENPLCSSDIASSNYAEKPHDGTDTPTASMAVETKEEETTANIVDEIVAGSTKTIE